MRICAREDGSVQERPEDMTQRNNKRGKMKDTGI